MAVAYNQQYIVLLLRSTSGLTRSMGEAVAVSGITICTCTVNDITLEALRLLT